MYLKKLPLWHNYSNLVQSQILFYIHQQPWNLIMVTNMKNIYPSITEDCNKMDGQTDERRSIIPPNLLLQTLQHFVWFSQLVSMWEVISINLKRLFINKCIWFLFSFEQVYGPSSSQQDMYEQCLSGMIKHVLQGQNTSVFAYGPTGAGKWAHTYIM